MFDTNFKVVGYYLVTKKNQLWDYNTLYSTAPIYSTLSAVKKLIKKDPTFNLGYIKITRVFTKAAVLETQYQLIEDVVKRVRSKGKTND